MNIAMSQNAGTIVLFLDGRLDNNTSLELQKKLDALPDFSELVLDFKSLAYMASAGLRILLTAQKNIDAQGRKMAIKHVNESIMDIFQMTGFADILTIEE